MCTDVCLHMYAGTVATSYKGYFGKSLSVTAATRLCSYYGRKVVELANNNFLTPYSTSVVLT